MEEFVEIEIDLDEETIKFLEKEAVDKKITVNDLIINILKAYLDFTKDANTNT